MSYAHYTDNVAPNATITVNTGTEDATYMIALAWNNTVIVVYWSTLGRTWRHCEDGWFSGDAPRLINWMPLPEPPV